MQLAAKSAAEKGEVAAGDCGGDLGSLGQALLEWIVQGDRGDIGERSGLAGRDIDGDGRSLTLRK